MSGARGGKRRRETSAGVEPPAPHRQDLSACARVGRMDMAGPLFIRGPAEASPRREAGRQRPWETRQRPQEGGGGQASERAGVRGRAGGTHRSADLTHATQPSVRARRPHLHACAWAEPASRPHAPPLTLRTPPLPASKNTTRTVLGHAVLLGDDLPELGTDLVTALSSLDCDELTHG